jgi:isopentenyl-diphosphate Delta-isomerase
MSERVYPKVTTVNEHDEVVGYVPLFDAIAQGLIRRVVAVFVFDETGKVLVQRRGAEVLSPHLLEYSAAGHVSEGDDYLTSAQTELFEELAVTDVVLDWLLPPFFTPGYFNGVFKTTLRADTPIVINPEEVAKVFWVQPSELDEMITLHPQQFTESFLAVWPHVRDKILV